MSHLPRIIGSIAETTEVERPDGKGGLSVATLRYGARPAIVARLGSRRRRKGTVRDSGLLVFDLDGTLYCTETSFVPVIHALFRRRAIAPPSRAEILRFVGEPLEVLLDWLIASGFSEERAWLERDIAAGELDAVRRYGQLYPGVECTLRALQQDGHTLALLTNGGREYGEAVLVACGIDHLFGAARYRRPGDDEKGEMLADLLGSVGRQRAVVIGDRYHDVRAGRANGCATVGATYGYGLPAELEDADWRIGAFEELPVALADVLPQVLASLENGMYD